MIKSLIVAHGKDLEIGKDNQLLWHLSDDLKNFKKYTIAKPIVMGRLTFESIGKALPKRTNIILSKQKNLEIKGCLVMHSFDEIDKWAKENSIEELVYIGGGRVYDEIIDEVDKMYITIVDGVFEADTFFPPYNLEDFKVTDQYLHTKDDKNDYSWKFLELTRKLY